MKSSFRDTGPYMPPEALLVQMQGQLESYTIKLTFNGDGVYERTGSFSLISKTPASTFPRLPHASGTAIANFYVASTWVRVDLKSGTLGSAAFAGFHFRVNDNSFFNAGLTGESVRLHPDSTLGTVFEALNPKGNVPPSQRFIQLDCAIRAEPASKITLKKRN